jgi:hypothetical protein
MMEYPVAGRSDHRARAGRHHSDIEKNNRHATYSKMRALISVMALMTRPPSVAARLAVLRNSSLPNRLSFLVLPAEQQQAW